MSHVLPPTPVVIRSREDLATFLADQISRGALKPGEALPSERSLADTYGLSRSMVREAIRTLDERKLIEVRPGKPSIVREATVDDAVQRMIEFFDHRGVTPRNLIEARAMIETTAAGLAAERATPEELQGISDVNTALITSELLLERVRLDLAFHIGIIRAARNPLIETMFHAIQPYTVELLLRSLTDAEVSRTGLAFHHRVLTAIADRDARMARREMRGHLTLGLTMFGDDIDRNLNLVAQDAIRKITNSHVTFQDVLDLSRS